MFEIDNIQGMNRMKYLLEGMEKQTGIARIAMLFVEWQWEKNIKISQN